MKVQANKLIIWDYTELLEDLSSITDITLEEKEDSVVIRKNRVQLVTIENDCIYHFSTYSAISSMVDYELNPLMSAVEKFVRVQPYKRMKQLYKIYIPLLDSYLIKTGENRYGVQSAPIITITDAKGLRREVYTDEEVNELKKKYDLYSFEIRPY